MPAKKVVLIQDDFDCNEIMRYLLEEEGIEVVVSDSEASIKYVDYDLAIIDEYTKGNTGTEICRELKTTVNTRSKPVLLTSTGLNIEHVAKLCKADCYMKKPFDIAVFSTLIKRLLDQQLSFAF